MAKKKVKDRAGKSLTAAEIKRFQKMVSDIGSKKKSGFIYMSTVNEVSGGRMKADGVLFSHDVHTPSMVGSLIEASGMDLFQVLATATQAIRNRE